MTKRKAPAAAWKPGQSGNPAGRPRGTRNQATMMALAVLEGEVEQIARRVTEAALGGDMTACRVVLERLVPPMKERPVALELPDTSTAGGIAAAQNAILQAVAAGDLLPGEGTILTGIVEGHRRALETLELEQRIAKLEESKNGEI